MCYLFAEPTESPTQPPPTEHLSNIEAQISIEFENVEKNRCKSLNVEKGP